LRFTILFSIVPFVYIDRSATLTLNTELSRRGALCRGNIAGVRV
jgi:hypothetical protein